MATATPSRLVERRHSEDAPIAGRILTVSESRKLIADIHRILPPPDFIQLPAHTAESKLATIDSDMPADVVLLDNIDGARHLLSSVERVLEERDANSTPPAILLLTSPESATEALQALHVGAYDFLTAPFSDGQLQAAVRRAIEYRRLQVQNDLFRHHFDHLLQTRTRILEDTMRQLEQSYDVTLEALGNALDLKDAETEGHSKRVTAYTLALGRAVGLTEGQLRMVGRGAFLHDIGKMAIPDAILRKPSSLTAEERETMRTHCELGYRMILKIPYLREAAEIVYAHQEFYDGSGYPRGLRGEQIPIGARIFAVADTFDAITSDRPYRKAQTLDMARKEILRCTGSQFDPAIVDVFLATPDSIWQDLREGIMREGREFSPFSYTFGPAT